MKQTKRKSYVIRILCSVFLLVAVSAAAIFMEVLQHSKAKAAVGMPTVQGNIIVDGYGNPLILKGAHIQSVLDRFHQYATTADWLAYRHLNSATFDVMVNDWHMNTVRIATSDYAWQKWPYGGPTAYMQTLQSIVAQANQAGLYVVLSMHEDLAGGLPTGQKEPTGWALPTPFAVTYWQAVATTFKNNPMVMFDIYNEPHVNETALKLDEPGWNIWMHGGTITYTTPGGVTKNYTFAGMQDLIYAIRGQGANQIIIAEAPENSFMNFESDCINLGMAAHCNFLQDPANTANPNIMYSVHEYFVPIGKTPRSAPFWDTKFGNLSSEVPIFIGEWEFSINTSFVTRCEDVTGTRSLTADEATQLVESVLSYMDAHGTSWTTFSFAWQQMLADSTYNTYNPTTLYTNPPFTGGSASPLAGDGWLIKQYLLYGLSGLPTPTPTSTS